MVSIEENLHNLDINWYFKDQYSRYFVAASAGGILPNVIIQNIEQNNVFHQIIMNLAVAFNVLINPNIYTHLNRSPFYQNDLVSYLHEFILLASKGLYAYDRLNIDDPLDTDYILVAYPFYNSKKDKHKFPFGSKNIPNIPKLDTPIVDRNEKELFKSSFKKINLIELFGDV